MAYISHVRLIQALKWVLLVSLFIFSCWFLKDVWIKFQNKDTSYKIYEVKRTDEQPTTVICFEPFSKPTILKKYNISVWDIVHHSTLKANLLHKSSEHNFFCVNKIA